MEDKGIVREIIMVFVLLGTLAVVSLMGVREINTRRVGLALRVKNGS